MDKKKLLKKMKKNKKITHKPSYIERMKNYYDLFSDFSDIKYLINNILEADRLLEQKQLPQDLPILLLPDDIQDTIFAYVNEKYPMGDPKGDAVWNQFVDQLPKLDKDIREFRDYLENQYGMWAYISAPFTNDIAKFLNGKKALEVMAGNGYISKGLRENGANAICTDNLDWKKENETGKHLVTDVESLDAIDAFKKYKDEIDYIIMCWSPDGIDIDWRLLSAIREYGKDIPLITIGEKYGATDSQQFWDNAEFIENEDVKKLNRHHKPFDLIEDQLYLIK
ncbi:SAM-dependent methyltransferase [Apilactobacillus kunkeei]|uniref:SAM-dependent methyltransferase n=1 Tax=Apilactobacillus kunkeei TaxID=148814 RepID=UPI00112C27D6|nr:SAM-dependent methyltransferase [Apilactobacillus kunkeei]TPR54174.1 SAM-dependent methyltransferase [Apilactobacillus kunkeei]